MVFESVVAEVLNRILGDYIENLDAKQLNIGIWGGDVVLQDLVLKQTALEDLNLPIQTVYGRLGKLVLKIPWKNLYGARVEAAIERLYLLVVPNLEVKYDPVKEEKLSLDIKQAELLRIETAKKKAAEINTKKPDDTFVEKLTTQIIKNVQVVIKDIHIRYEDRITNPGRPFALGISLNNLSIESTNDEWKAAIVTDAVSKIFKILNLDALAAYWNCNCPLYSTMPVVSILKYFEEGIATRDTKPNGYTYVLGPINSSARLRLNPKPDKDEQAFSTPKVLLNLEMEKLAIGLTKRQYQDIMLLAESMERMSRGLPYRKYRPFLKTYKGHYREWWKFAYTCILEEEVRRRKKNWDWTHIYNHRLLCKNYAKAYQNKLTQKKITADDQTQITEGEKKLDLTNLVIIRQRIELEVERIARQSHEIKKTSSWFSSWWGSSAKDKDEELSSTVNIMKKFEEAMTSDEKEKLYRAIDYQENSAPAEYPESFIATNCAFLLRCLELEIRDDTSQIPRILTTELKGVNCRLQQRPAQKSLKVAVKIDQFTVFGVQQDEFIPQLVSSEDFSEGGILLDVMFETNPLDKNCDQRLIVKSLPLRVIYDAQTIIQVVEVFKTPQNIALDQLQAAASSKMANLKEVSVTGLQHTIQQSSVMDLDITLSAPYIIIPYGGVFSSSKAALVVNLGNVKIKSIERGPTHLNVRQMYREGTTEENILKEMMLQSYDKFRLELSDMQVLIANENEKWANCILENVISPMHLLQPMNLIVNINKCLVTDDPRLPKMKLAGELPSIMLNVSDDRILRLVSLISSIPLPGNDEVQSTPIHQTASIRSSNVSLFMVDIPTKKTEKPKATDLDNFVQATNLDVKFEMKELVITVSKKKLNSNKSDSLEKLIQFRCISLEFDMIQQTFNLNTIIRLGGIDLIQYRSLGPIQIISTPMTSGQAEYLFILDYLQVDKKSPEFHSKFNSCEQRLNLNFTNIQLQLHQEALQDLLQFSNDFQNHLTNVSKPPADEDRIASIHTKQISSISIDASSSKFKLLVPVKSQKTLVETITLKLNAKFDELDILMANDNRKIASFAVKGIATDIVVKKSYTQIIATLTDIVVTDLNPNSIHSKILCRIQSKEAINAQIILYNLDKQVDYNKNDMSVYISMSCLRITFLNLFVSSVLDFLNKFQAAQETILEASAAAAETAKMNMQSAYENSTRIDMKINIEAPVIIIPTNSLSYNVIVADLGNISITNSFIKLDVLNERGQPAVVDKLKLNIQDIKISRVLLNKELEKKVESTLLQPLSFILKINRNLSTSWYNNIPDIDIAGEMNTIEVTISEVDYSKIMQVLSENLAEGVETVQPQPKPQKQPVVQARVDVEQRKTIKSNKEKFRVFTPPEKQPHTFLRFTFTMESLIVKLFKGGTILSSEEDLALNHLAKNGLAQFTMLVLSVKGRILTDNSITTSLLLVDCLLDDIRDGRVGKLTRLMERKERITNKTATVNDPITRSMIDITYQQNKSDMFVDVRIYSFNLILSIDYLMKIASFFSSPKDEIDSISTKTTKTSIKSKNEVKSNKSEISMEKTDSNMTINLKVEKPDIILVERMDNIDTYALILNNEVLLNIRLAGANQNIRGSINDLQLYSCCYNPLKRNETKYSVLHPCNIIIHGATPLNQGLHLDITLSKIHLSVSPAIIELLSRIQNTMYASDTTAAADSNEITYYDDIWEIDSFEDSDFWFLKTEEGQDAMETIEKSMNIVKEERPSALNEICNIIALSIVFTIEAGVGHKTVPMLLLETSFESRIHNWSSKLHVDASFTMQMAYYNSRIAIWEPLIEPVEVTENNHTIHVPWELKVELRKNEQEEQYIMSPQSENEPIEEISFTPPVVCVNVFSNVNLELVVTKTLLEVVTNLGNAFSNAMKVGIPASEAEKAPYKVINDTGLKITIKLAESVFQLYNIDNQQNQDYNEVLLEKGAEVQLDLKIIESSNITLHIPSNISSVSLSQEIDDKYLIVYVHDMNYTLRLPVVKADKRYFPLNHRDENKNSWGLISDVTVEGAETIITLRSILQVHNHFNQSVSVYYMMNRDNELEFIKKVPPNTFCNIPLSAVYTRTNEFFFSVENHCVSAMPYVWKDLQHNLSMVKTLSCPSGRKNNIQPFVMKVCGDIEQILFENTSKHTMISTCYNIHLRPAVTFKNCLPIQVACFPEDNTNEIIVKPGEHLHMPNVLPGSSYIILKLIDYLEKQWSCRIDILTNPSEFTVWQFDSHDSASKMTLDLGMHCLNKDGTIFLSLYCPFWMLNKTGLMLSYRKSSKSEKSLHSGSPAKNSDENTNILHHPEDFKSPILFSFNAKNFFGKKKASIRIDTGEWSDKFSLDVAGSSGTVVCKANHVFHQIGVHNQLTYNGLTKQVTFTPYFVLINNAPFAIECQELERPADAWVVVEANSCTPLWPRCERDDKLLKIKISNTNEISAPFLITEVHTSLLKIPNKFGGVNVDVQVTEGGIYITFTQYQPGLAPVLIINHTDSQMILWERESPNVRRIPGKYKLLYTWQIPSGPRLLVWETSKKKEIEDDLRKDGLGEFYVQEDKKVYWVSFLDGIQRILLFTEDPSIARDAQSAGDLENIEQEITVSIHGVGISVINNLIGQEIMYIGIASSGIIWETCKMSSKRFKQLSIKECNLIEMAYQQYLENEAEYTGSILIDSKMEIDFRNELMLRPHKRRLRRAFQTGLWLQLKTSPNQMQLHAKINRLQMDNQIYDCIFPVVLAPVPPPKSVAANSALKPFAEVSIVQRIMKHSTVQQYKYFKVLIQEFHIKVDLGFINALMTVFEAKDLSDYDEENLFLKDLSLVSEPLMSHVSTQSLQEQKNFYDLLHFSPLKIHISFSLASPSSANPNGSATTTNSSTPAFLNVLLQGLGVTLTDIQDVVFRLAYFEREYSFLTQKQLINEASSHYVGQAVKQLYVLVLGLDVIGNPYGLVLGISKGVEDLFYEPFQGAIQGPGEFAEGLVLGVRSLFGHTVGGAAGAVSRITGVMGKGIAALTFDKDYQRKRRDQINKKPANIQEGIARGGKGLVMGVVDGVTGVFTKPISGAKEQGVEGFFKGLGKGAVGLVTRPTAGVIDFASGSLDAVKRATEMSDEVNRLRPPRCMKSDGVVRPYVRSEAEGNKLLRDLEKGKYANTDVYSFHMWIIDGKDILLLTDKRIAYVVHNDIFGNWQVEWSYTWTEIKMPAKVVDRGVQIQSEEPKKKVLGLFGSADNGKIIIIPDLAQRELVKDKIEKLRQNA